MFFDLCKFFRKFLVFWVVGRLGLFGLLSVSPIVVLSLVGVAYNLQITELKTTWYGMQEFYLKDLNGYILGFAEKAE
ncbi:hypothetical protein HMPREF9700_02066 [Bergeyella zoohelcum CCUG 30536]|uniref:Uncharacterized protein n=1 Tax=Bergeyella zoohelcum TaxID=1015 RepID=A0A376C193_9FLAO|nr:hypothetical protein HMPREF9700_02066 [Bergeyella zoohelcum CCUG 30536]SSZ55799.1 Uncharacterised protein [Bergeyella zoohelcum]